MNFQPLLDEFGIHLKAEDVLERWSEPHRKYHTLSHLYDLVEQIQTNSELVERERNLLLLAAFFHDSIYDPKRKDNEERSAQLLEYNSPKTDGIKHIAQIIRDTKDHTSTEYLSKLFSEMDMAIVTRSLPDLLEWERGIRYEYSHYSSLVYTIGRVQFIRKMIQRYPVNSKNLRKLQWAILLPKSFKL